MTDDVTIPAVMARSIAEWVRLAAGSTVPADDAKRWADALDPNPPVRRVLAETLCEAGGGTRPSYWQMIADDALRVVRACIADLPVVEVDGTEGLAAWEVELLSSTPEVVAYRDRVLALFDEVRPSPTCSAHGQTVAEHGGVDCAKPSWRCSCETFAAYGLHWDTCPGRGRFDGADQ